MRRQRGTWKRIVLLALAALWMLCMTAAADEASGDNSLYSLGLENGDCSPEFYYSTLEYNVTVPAGTTELQLNPVTSDPNANIIDISGTQLDENGNGTVYITVEAPNGAQVSYLLNVTSDGASAAAEETETEETEDPQAAQAEKERKQAESEEAARLAAAQRSNEEKLNTLTTENGQLAERLDLLLKVLYGLIAFAVILLFFIINQSLRNKDLKDELKEARTEADRSNEFARKERNMQSDYYYAPVQGVNQKNMSAGQMQRADATSNMQAVFGNASQRLQAQPMPGQAYAPAAETQTMSKKEQKKMEKAAKKAEKKGQRSVQQPVQQPMRQSVQQHAQQPAEQAEQLRMQQLLDAPIQATIEEPDVKLDLIDL